MTKFFQKNPQPANRPILGTLEIGRFIAASLVVMTHFFPDLPRFACAPAGAVLGNIHTPGAIAVQYFFVLSGFVMMTAHRRDFGRLASVPKFWWRRACRIYPMYWIGLGIICYYLFGALTPVYALKLFLLQPAQVADFIGPAWSLHYEVAFYLMFGLCLLPYIGRPLLAAWVFSVVLCWAPASFANLFPASLLDFLRWLSFAYAGHFLAPFEFYFFAGLLGGWVFACLPLRLGGSLGLLIVGLAVLADYVPALRWGYSYGDPMTAPVTGLGFAAIIVGLANLERLGWLRFGATAQRLGAMSYPLYILHTPLILVVDSSFGWLRLGTVGLNMLAVAGFLALYLLIAIVTFALDQPLQRLLRHLSRREKNVSSGPASIEVSI